MAKLTHTLSFICTVLLVAHQLAIVNGLEAEEVVVGTAELQDGTIEARQAAITTLQSSAFSTITSLFTSFTSPELIVSITPSPSTHTNPNSTTSNSPPTLSSTFSSASSSAPTGPVGTLPPPGGNPLGKTYKTFFTYAHDH